MKTFTTRAGQVVTRVIDTLINQEITIAASAAQRYPDRYKPVGKPALDSGGRPLPQSAPETPQSTPETPQSTPETPKEPKK